MTKHPDMPDEEFTPLSSGVLNPLAKERALGRIGYYVTTMRRGKEVDYWAVLNWFVQLANEDLTKILPVKLKQRVAEYRTLQEVSPYSFMIGGFNNVPPAIETFRELQTTVKQHLNQLLDTGRLKTGPFSVELSVSLPLNSPEGNDANRQTHRLYYGERFYPPSDEIGNGTLIYVLSRCLQRFGHMLRRCLYCQNLFLQKRLVLSKRREGKYCEDTCRALSRKRRLKEKKAEEAAQTKLKGRKRRTHDSKTRGRADHGKKRR
ncbi:MAG: hypothetical protein CAF45_016305 [Nitrospira sp. CG24E]|nr:MAG: hypothetical protein CAF45_016305 [Nitrospira sp. CG24E]